MYRTLNPTSGELVESYDTHDDDAVERALEAAAAAFASWRRRPIAVRSDLLLKAADALEARAPELARLMALEMGKPLAQGEGEANKCAWVCRYYAEHGQEQLARRELSSDGSAAYARHDPLGPILAVMPWNFPFWQVFRFGAAALLAGNVVLMKHAPNTPGCALAIVELLAGAGAEPGVFQNLFLTNDQAARLITHPAVRGVTLTGSTRAGREVASTAGRSLKPMVLELGGSDPFIVLEDADLDAAAAAGTVSRCLNNGQSCIAAKRFLVARPVMEGFVERLTGEMAKQTVGDPREPGTAIGPLAREDLRAGLRSQVERSVEAGAEIAWSAPVVPEKGFFLAPAVLTGVQGEMPAAREELFGPVASVLSFKTEEEMLALANGTAYGLGASLWSSDRGRAERLAGEIEAGNVFVNGMVKSDPRLPFGGVKDSGFGRELAADGILEFVNTKTVWIA